jgi:hypothetical protein
MKAATSKEIDEAKAEILALERQINFLEKK